MTSVNTTVSIKKRFLLSNDLINTINTEGFVPFTNGYDLSLDFFSNHLISKQPLKQFEISDGSLA